MVTTERYRAGTDSQGRMLPLMRLGAVVAACVLLIPLVGTTAATPSGDCGSGGDAGDTPGTALQIQPSVYCEFTLESHSNGPGNDYFSFDLPADESAYLVYLRGDSRGLKDPSGTSYLMTAPITTMTSSAAGEWTLRFTSQAQATPAERFFALYSNKLSFEGHVLVGNTVIHGVFVADLDQFEGVNGQLGPAEGPVVDGQWIDLPIETTGIEMLFNAVGQPSVWFYDGEGEWIENYDCYRLSGSCRAPAGAARMLVTSDAIGVHGVGAFGVGANLDYAFDLYW